MRKTTVETTTEESPPPAATHRIAAIPAAGFCRAGRRWCREGEEVSRGEFSDEQWAALEGEPLLVVVAL